MIDNVVVFNMKVIDSQPKSDFTLYMIFKGTLLIYISVIKNALILNVVLTL